jgi:hypothetical protein
LEQDARNRSKRKNFIALYGFFGSGCAASRLCNEGIAARYPKIANAWFPRTLTLDRLGLAADRPDQCRQTGDYRGQPQQRG